MSNESTQTELDLWQSRCDELQVRNEILRDERDKARSLAALLEAELANYDKLIHELSATVDRLRLHIQQGVEL